MMVEESVYKVIPIIAIPMVISMLIDSFYNVADTYFVSQLGTTATAAVGINDSIMHFIRAISLGFGIGAASYISRLMGAKREKEANRVASTAFFTAICSLTLIAAIASFFTSPLVTLLGATTEAKQYSMDYARFILISAPFTSGEVVLSQLLRSEGSTKFSMIGMVSGCVINIGLDPLFIHTFGLGVAGAAIATTISKFIGFCVLLYPFLRHHTLLEIRLRDFTPKAYMYKEIARMGIPTFIRSFVMTVALVITNNFARSFGTEVLAASAVSSKCTRFVASAIMGFGQGFQPVAGYNWGARCYTRVREAFWGCSFIGFGISIVFGGAMFIFSKQLIQIFDKDPAVVSVALIFMRTQSATMIFHTWGAVVNSIFQALGRAIPAGIMGLARQVIFLIPAVIILSLTAGSTGLACSQAAADVLCMTIAIPLIIKLMRELKGLRDGEDSGDAALAAAERNAEKELSE